MNSVCCFHLINGDVYSPVNVDSTVKQTIDRRQTGLTTNEKRQHDKAQETKMTTTML